MKTSRWIVLLCICCMLACRYDTEDELYPGGSCVHTSRICDGGDLPEPGLFGYFFELDSSNVRYVHANPNNVDELIYYKPYGGGQLYKYNLQTHTNLLLFSGGLLSKPSWGLNGWILLNSTDHKLWRVNEYGDVQLVDDSYSCHGGLWNRDGEKFMYGWQNEQLIYFGLPVRNAQYELVDTLTRGGTSWMDDILIRSGEREFAVATFNCLTNEVGTLHIKSNHPLEMMTDAIWSYDGSSIFFAGGVSGLYDYNLQSGQQSYLRCKCSNDFYSNLGIWGPDHLICTRDHWEDRGGSHIKVIAKIVRIRTDGSEEIEIAIP